MTGKYYFKILFILAMLAVGILYGRPHIIRQSELAKTGQTYYPWTQEASFDMFNVHAARYRQIIDGDFFDGEIDTSEHAGAPIFWPILSALLFAPFLLLTKSISASVIITDIIFPILIFLCFYFLFKSLTKNRGVSLFASFVLLLFPQLPLLLPPSSLGELKNIFWQLWPIPVADHIVVNLTFLRREAFIPAAPFLISFIYLVHRLLISDRTDRILAISAGVFYGLLFYFYFYYWVFATVFLGILFFALIVSKRNLEAVRILWVGLIGTAVSIPFWINQYNLNQLPQYQELAQRLGLEVGHGARLFLWKTYLLYFVMAGLVLWLGTKIKKSTTSVVVTSLAISQIIVLNIQIATGFNVQSDHWSGRVFLIINGIVISVLLYYLYLYFRPRFPKYNYAWTLSVIAVIVSILLISNVAYSQSVIEKKDVNRYTIDSGLTQAYEWLDKNTPKDSVVLTPSLATSIDLPVFTHNKIFLARAQNSIAPEEELLKRLFITYKMFSVSADYLDQILQTERGVIYFFTAKYESRALDRYLRPQKYGGLSIPDAVRQKAVSDYINFVLPDEIPYKLDYIFVGAREREIGMDEKILNGYEQVYSDEGTHIYKVN